MGKMVRLNITADELYPTPSFTYDKEPWFNESRAITVPKVLIQNVRYARRLEDKALNELRKWIEENCDVETASKFRWIGG